MATTKAELLKVIRRHCLNCCSNSSLDVEGCAGDVDSPPNVLKCGGNGEGGFSACVLYPYRLGVDPIEPSKAKREQGKKAYERNIRNRKKV